LRHHPGRRSTREYPSIRYSRQMQSKRALRVENDQSPSATDHDQQHFTAGDRHRCGACRWMRTRRRAASHRFSKIAGYVAVGSYDPLSAAGGCPQLRSEGHQRCKERDRRRGLLSNAGNRRRAPFPAAARLCEPRRAATGKSACTTAAGSAESSTEGAGLVAICITRVGQKQSGTMCRHGGKICDR
jgi:hypothetical protein